jgi:hypothetical protein
LEINVNGIIAINKISFLEILLIQLLERKDIAKITKNGVIENRKWYPLTEII